MLVECFFQHWIPAHATVLDLGCGYGEFLRAVRCARRIGVDLNPDARRFLPADVDLHNGPVDDLSFLPDGTIDVVFSSNMLEHLDDKRAVERTLREVWRVLRPGGSVMLLGPNMRYLPGEYWDFWDHLVPLTDRSLAEVLVTLGFELTHQVPRFLPYTTRSALPRAPALVRLYLRVPVVWPLLGRQFFVRAIKPASR